jgi:hypothetical protein
MIGLYSRKNSSNSSAPLTTVSPPNESFINFHREHYQLQNMLPSFASSPYEQGLMRQPSSKYTTTAFETLLRLQLHKLLHNQASFQSISLGRLDLVNKWRTSERQVRPLTSQISLDNDADLRAILNRMKEDIDPRDKDPLEEMLEDLCEIILHLNKWKRISARIDVSNAEWLGIFKELQSI